MKLEFNVFSRIKDLIEMFYLDIVKVKEDDLQKSKNNENYW